MRIRSPASMFATRRGAEKFHALNGFTPKRVLNRFSNCCCGHGARFQLLFPIVKSFAGLLLQYAQGETVDMRDLLESIPVRQTSVREYARTLMNGPDGPFSVPLLPRPLGRERYETNTIPGHGGRELADDRRSMPAFDRRNHARYSIAIPAPSGRQSHRRAQRS